MHTHENVQTHCTRNETHTHSPSLHHFNVCSVLPPCNTHTHAHTHTHTHTAVQIPTGVLFVGCLLLEHTHTHTHTTTPVRGVLPWPTLPKRDFPSLVKLMIHFSHTNMKYGKDCLRRLRAVGTHKQHTNTHTCVHPSLLPFCRCNFVLCLSS